jgi:hypothetical protein
MSDSAFVQYPPPETPSPQKKRRAKLFAVIGAAAVIIAAAIFALPALAGNSYQKAELNFFKTILEAVPAEDGPQRGAVRFEADYIPAEWMLDGTGIEDVGLSGDLAYAGGQFAANLALSAGGDSVRNIVCAYDGEVATLALPDLTQYYFKLLLSGGGGADFGLAQLDRKALETTFTEIAKVYFAAVKDVTEITKDTVISGGNVAIECDKYTIDFTEAVAAEIALSAINQLRQNGNLMQFIASAAAALSNQDDTYDGAGVILDELLDALDEGEAYFADLEGGGRLFRMTVWVRDGNVIARKIDGFEYTDAEISYRTLITRDAAYVEIKAEYDGAGASLTGDFARNADAWNGMAEVSVRDDYTEYIYIAAECDGMKLSGGKPLGAVSVKCAMEYMEGAFELDIVYGEKGDMQTVEIGGNVTETYYGNTWDVGELTLAYAVDGESEMTLPVYDEAYAVDPNDYYSEENAERADDMSRQLGELIDSGKYEDNQLLSGLLWALWSAADGLGGYGYGYEL